MQQVAEPVLDRPVGCNQSLGQHLSAENPLGPAFWTQSTENVDFDLLQIEEPEQLGHRR